MEIHRLSALTTNYIWIIKFGENTVVIDPGDAAPVIEFLNAEGRYCDAILITHHHYDHTGGIEKLKTAYPNCKLYGPTDKICKIDSIKVSPHAPLQIPQVQSKIKIIHTPGHTLDHICYVTDGMLFCGDTLFSVGCGRLFEGDGQNLYDSLIKISKLPSDTIIYPAHEYTQENIRFALTIEPNNTALQKYQLKVDQLISQGKPTLPTTLAHEKSVNPFLRTHLKIVQEKVSQLTQRHLTSSIDTLIALRQLKDQFK